MAEAFFLPDGDPPTWRQRRLGMELRRIREALGLGPNTAAALLDRTVSSLSKLENAQRGIPRPALEQILDRYRVTDPDLRESLHTLARDAKKQGWWQTYQGAVAPSMLDYIALEANATRIRSLQLHLIPGLLQIPAYARAVIESGISSGRKPDIEGLAALRAKRQQLLTTSGAPQFHFMIGEGALRQAVGGSEVMRRQLAHLQDVAALDNVLLRILPFSAGAHPGHNGSFTWFDVDGLGVVLVESLTKGWYLESAQDLDRYSLVLDHVSAACLSVVDSQGVLERLVSGS